MDIELFESTCLIATGFLGGLLWSACWGALSFPYALFGCGLFAMTTATIALILTVKWKVKS